MDNFIVSARKYRPATFESVIGQSHITSTLKNAINRGQLAHAYLFCGPRGVGKTTCARIFAKAINCLNMTADGEACNACESCKGFNESRSFNIHELDAASNNSVDDIRNLTDQVRIPPQLGKYSVYIIDEVHMLSVQAFNAFLKTLEEPPGHVVFILATTEKHKIIPTILSRCQIYDFNRIKVEDTVQYLKYIAGQENVTYDDESLHVIAQKADGGMRDALSMFDKVVSFCGGTLSIQQTAETLNVLDYETYFRITDHMLNGRYTDALLLLDEVLRKGFSAQIFTGGLNNHFRDLLVCKNPQTVPLLEVTGTVAERYKQQSQNCPVPFLFEGINLLTAIDNGLRTAVNQRLNVELGLMKLCGLGQKKNDDPDGTSLPTLNTAVNQGSSTVATSGVQAPPLEISGSSRTPDNGSGPHGSNPAGGVMTPAEVSTAEPEKSRESAPKEETYAPSPAPEKNGVTAPAGPSDEPKSSGLSAPLPSPSAKPTPSPASAPSVTSEKETVSLSGRSISSILNGDFSIPEPREADNVEAQETEITDTVDIESALEKGCALFARELMEKRPRMGNIFQDVQIRNNMISLKVPNESSYDELMNGLTEMKQRLGELSGVRAVIEFDIAIEADKNGLKPIKVEDRLKHLTDKNTLLNDLRQRLELDVE